MQNNFINMEYHIRQRMKPYRSTVFFEQFLSKNLCMKSINILDIACGTGGMISYIAEKHKDCNFLGIDIQDFSEYFKDEPINLKFELGDIFNLNSEYRDQFTGVTCIQSLLAFPNYKDALEEICKLNADWIAVSILGYEGKINYNIEIEDYESIYLPEGECQYFHFNVYSIPLLKQFFEEHGYKEFIFEKFEIDVDLEKPMGYEMGTYTVMIADGYRMQISGAMLMPWYFILAKK